MKRQIGTTAKSVKKPVIPLMHDDDNYELFLSQIRDRFLSIVKKDEPLFLTEQQDLFGIFLKNIPSDIRQHYNCNACRQFTNKFGGVVSIDYDGKITPVMWNLDRTPPLYRKAVIACFNAVTKSKVISVFASSEKVWGHPVTGIWHHMAVTPPKKLIFMHSLLSADQYMAEKYQDYLTLLNAIREFPLNLVEKALTLLDTNTLYRSEKVLGVAEWFKNVHTLRALYTNHDVKNNITWKMVATAPTGFCHIKSSMIGTLLEDLKMKLPYSEVKRKFDEKMSPVKYQRPQAAPTTGNIKAAEKIISKLEAEGSLERRFAKLEEIDTIWMPDARRLIRSLGKTSKRTTGVFSNVKTKDSQTSNQRNEKMRLPGGTMTWVKFEKEILPKALKIEFRVPFTGNFTALVTAVHDDAPPILAWDTKKKRNPISWYVYHGGSAARQWTLESGKYCDVTGICMQPSMWYGDFSNHGESVMFILDGAKDTINGSLGLFPEILKSEFHEIRSTIEAYSHSKKLKGLHEASACGMKLEKSQKWDHVIRVTTSDYVTEITLDRWD